MRHIRGQRTGVYACPRALVLGVAETGGAAAGGWGLPGEPLCFFYVLNSFYLMEQNASLNFIAVSLASRIASEAERRMCVHLSSLAPQKDVGIIGAPIYSRLFSARN